MTEKKRPRRRRTPKPPRGPAIVENPWPMSLATKTVEADLKQLVRQSQLRQVDVDRQRQPVILASIEQVFRQDEANSEYFFQSIANLLSMALNYHVNEFAINVRADPDPKATVIHIKWRRSG